MLYFSAKTFYDEIFLFEIRVKEFRAGAQHYTLLVKSKNKYLANDGLALVQFLLA